MGVTFTHCAKDCGPYLRAIAHVLSIAMPVFMPAQPKQVFKDCELSFFNFNR